MLMGAGPPPPAPPAGSRRGGGAARRCPLSPEPPAGMRGCRHRAPGPAAPRALLCGLLTAVAAVAAGGRALPQFSDDIPFRVNWPGTEFSLVGTGVLRGCEGSPHPLLQRSLPRWRSRAVAALTGQPRRQERGPAAGAPSGLAVLFEAPAPHTPPRRGCFSQRSLAGACRKRHPAFWPPATSGERVPAHRAGGGVFRPGPEPGSGEDPREIWPENGRGNGRLQNVMVGRVFL